MIKIGGKNMNSILQNEKKCYVCGTVCCLEGHHIFFGTANRKKSEKHGLKVWLCRKHHTGSSIAVHHNQGLDLMLKRKAQEHFEAHCGSREDFRREFGKSYLE